VTFLFLGINVPSRLVVLRTMRYMNRVLHHIASHWLQISFWYLEKSSRTESMHSAAIHSAYAWTRPW